MNIRFAFGIALAIFGASSHAAMDEFPNCNVPQEVVFQRVHVNNVPMNRRFESYAGYNGGNLFPRGHKNPEEANGNGPARFQNCSVGANPSVTQRIRFNLRTAGYFNSGIADHLAIALRGYFWRQLGVNGGTQVGRGLAIFPGAGAVFSGVFMENFSDGNLFPKNEAVPVLEDYQNYQVELRASPDWIRVIIRPENGAWIYDRAHSAENGVLSETGFGVGVLCKNGLGGCEYSPGDPLYHQEFEIRMSSIVMDWKHDSQFGY